jgi:Peptidase propeptide and YPEB domain
MPRSLRLPARPLLLALVVAAAPLLAAPPASAGRAPSAEERVQVETALRNLGFVRWKEIEFENGVWEVDDARAADGRDYDLKLRPGTFEVIERKAD